MLPQYIVTQISPIFSCDHNRADEADIRPFLGNQRPKIFGQRERPAVIPNEAINVALRTDCQTLRMTEAFRRVT